MGRTAPLRIALVLGLVAAPAGTAAQCRLCETSTGSGDSQQPSAPVRLEVRASLDFDRIILLSTSDGSATLHPDGSRSVSGSVGTMGGRAMVGTAIVRGEAGRPIRVDLPRHIELFSVGGGRIMLEEIVSDLPAMPKLDSAGNLSFRFGGRLRISGDAEGEYRGDLPITVEYF